MPVVVVQTGTEYFDVPYVLATDVVMCSPGSGFAAMLIGQRSTGIVAPLVIGTLANTELFGVGAAMAVLLIPAAIVGLAITYVTVQA